MLSVVNSLCVVWEKSLNWTQESEVCTAGCEFLKLCVKIWENGELFQEEEKLWNRTEIRERAVQEHKMSVSHINFKYVLDVNNTERTWSVCASIKTLLDKEQTFGHYVYAGPPSGPCGPDCGSVGFPVWLL